jgi:hypothetical protein
MGGCGVNCTTERVGAELVTFQFSETVVKVPVSRKIGHLVFGRFHFYGNRVYWGTLR